MRSEDHGLLGRVRAGLSERYNVERELGRGGMATVFLAHDRRHDRPVALKVLMPELAASVAADRLLREIRIVAQLQHPNVLMLIDSGTVDGLPYFVMPYVEGESLRDRLVRSGALPIEEALRIVRQAARALAHAHERGIVHRDVKPENILLAGDQAVLADFGIAQALDESAASRLTGTGLAIGTPAYMSPEQWSGSYHVDGRADVYALTCVLFEMLAGEPPFQGSSPQALLARHSSETAPPIRAFRPAVAEEVEAIIRKGLEKTPADRFGSALEFAIALETLDTRGFHRPPGIGRALRTLRSRPRWIAGALLLAAGVGAGVLASRPSESASANDVVVVAALDNETGDPGLDFVGRMAAHEITLGLQRANQRVVPSPVAVQATDFLKHGTGGGDRRDPVRFLATETGARYVVSGAYYTAGDSLSFRVQMTDAAEGRAIAAPDAIAAPRGDPGAAIAELGQRVIGQLAVYRDERISVPAAAGPPPTIESYRAFSEGLDHYVRNEFRTALPNFREAIALDSTAVQAMLYAALCHNNLGEWAQSDSLATVAEGRSDRLTDYDRAWLGYVRGQVKGDHEEARRAIRRAVELGPESKASYNLAWVALQMNRPAEALEALANLDPDRGAMRGWFPYWTVLTDALHRSGEHARELAAAGEARRRHPDEIRTLQMEAEALIALRRTAELEPLLVEIEGRGSGVQAGAALRAIAFEMRMHGSAEAAPAILDRALQSLLRPSQPDTAAEANRSWRASVLEDADRFAEAEALVRVLASEHPDGDQYRAWLGQFAARRRDFDEARAVDDWLSTLEGPYLFGMSVLHRARLAALVGDRDKALRLFEQAIREGLAIPRHPDGTFASLRGWEPFERLLEPRG